MLNFLLNTAWLFIFDRLKPIQFQSTLILNIQPQVAGEEMDVGPVLCLVVPDSNHQRDDHRHPGLQHRHLHGEVQAAPGPVCLGGCVQVLSD